ncbi:MAG TPA: DUF3105 domain-containing protein [Ktedonobacterales bacterium]|jgi:hypothetical protein
MSQSRKATPGGKPRRLSRREEEEQRRQERLREEQQQARAQQLRRIGWVSGGVVALGVVVYLIVHAIVTAPTALPPAPASIPGVVTYSNLSRNHVQGHVNYPQTPPVGGDHNPVWLNCGIYTQPVPNENAVHSLEHGAVWITYQPNLVAADVTRLQNLVRGHDYVILSPYDGPPSPVVASAWGLQLKVNSASDPRIAQFISKYAQGPQTPEPGAPCSGGTGTPAS